jgi:hypothetical protein
LNNSDTTFRFIAFLLSISILLAGCHSFYEVPKDNYSNLERMNDIKIVYKNGKEFIVEKDDTTNVKMVEDSLIVYQGIETKSIGMNEVEKIREARFDFGRTLSLVVGTVVGFILAVGLFVWAMGGYDPGG